VHTLQAAKGARWARALRTLCGGHGHVLSDAEDGGVIGPHDDFQSIDLETPKVEAAPRTIGFRRVPCEEPTAKDTMTGIFRVGYRLGDWRDRGYRAGDQEPYA
jgi:hypothetical protein